MDANKYNLPIAEEGLIPTDKLTGWHVEWCDVASCVSGSALIPEVVAITKSSVDYTIWSSAGDDNGHNVRLPVGDDCRTLGDIPGRLLDNPRGLWMSRKHNGIFIKTRRVIPGHEVAKELYRGSYNSERTGGVARINMDLLVAVNTLTYIPDDDIAKTDNEYLWIRRLAGNQFAVKRGGNFPIDFNGPVDVEEATGMVFIIVDGGGCGEYYYKFGNTTRNVTARYSDTLTPGVYVADGASIVSTAEGRAVQESDVPGYTLFDLAECVTPEDDDKCPLRLYTNRITAEADTAVVDAERLRISKREAEEAANLSKALLAESIAKAKLVEIEEAKAARIVTARLDAEKAERVVNDEIVSTDRRQKEERMKDDFSRTSAERKDNSESIKTTGTVIAATATVITAGVLLAKATGVLNVSGAVGATLPSAATLASATTCSVGIGLGATSLGLVSSAPMQGSGALLTAGFASGISPVAGLAIVVGVGIGIGVSFDLFD